MAGRLERTITGLPSPDLADVPLAGASRGAIRRKCRPPIDALRPLYPIALGFPFTAIDAAARLPHTSANMQLHGRPEWRLARGQACGCGLKSPSLTRRAFLFGQVPLCSLPAARPLPAAPNHPTPCRMSTERFDVAIIGGGHNGLVCAAYLAGAGLARRRAREERRRRRRRGDRGVPSGLSATRSPPTPSACSIRRSSRSRSRSATACGSSSGRLPTSGRWTIARSLLMPYGLAGRQAAIAAFSAARCRAAARLRRGARAGGEPAARPGRCSTPPNAGGGIAEIVRNARPRRAGCSASRSTTSGCSSISSPRAPPTFSTAGSRARWSRRAFAFDGIVGAYAAPVDARHGLRAAAPLLRRGERQVRRLGPRHRRHGRHHARPCARSAEARRRGHPHRRSRRARR